MIDISRSKAKFPLHVSHWETEPKKIADTIDVNPLTMTFLKKICQEVTTISPPFLGFARCVNGKCKKEKLTTHGDVQIKDMMEKTDERKSHLCYVHDE